MDKKPASRYITLDKDRSSYYWTHDCCKRQVTAIYVRLVSKTSAEVHWDYQPGEVKDVLFENEQYLDGYIIGLLDALDIPNRHRCCHSGFTGTITGLPHDKAEKLAGLIADKLIPLCEARKKQIKHYNNLPHVKYHREKEQSQTQ